MSKRHSENVPKTCTGTLKDKRTLHLCLNLSMLNFQLFYRVHLRISYVDTPFRVCRTSVEIVSSDTSIPVVLGY